MGRGIMTQTERFTHLLHEFERVGVDPEALSAGLAVSESDMLAVLAALPADAGPAALLAELRRRHEQNALHLI